MERRLAAILAADVVGYSRLMGGDEAGTMARLEDLKAEILLPLIEQHHGRVVKLMGDGFLVEFASVVEALTCALAWQEVVEHWSLTTLREKLIKIGAKVVRHGRYATFPLAEVAIPRALFADILRLIDGLRPAPLLP